MKGRLTNISTLTEIVHIVLWKLKDTPEARSQVEKIKDLPSSGRIVCEMGDNKIVGEARSQGYNWGMYSVWNSFDELHAYAISKEHVDCANNFVKPNTTGSLAYDWELPEGL
ncbi:hypothetical protein QFC22_001354 [Naganishia vaughanmartiniae]|uniref:Uncharacterized protein n=1 Tax=Naganishia vaughanmartiniae TaxID=1424756 RepID=A0ACC2XJC5_9TREE|nr:hypothetical protein QFC22_001354 [Naganishia vaughanmartiniae]